MLNLVRSLKDNTGNKDTAALTFTAVMNGVTCSVALNKLLVAHLESRSYISINKRNYMFFFFSIYNYVSY
jgi:hypothetical protein